MSFCKFSSQSIISNKTEVDNIFISEFLPYAPDNAVKVYLYGLFKCSSPSSSDNSLERFSKVLKIDEDEIMEIFEFWQNEGLVQILSDDPVEIRYMPLKNVLTNTKKYNVDKYGNFAQKAQEIIEGRMISPSEFGVYFDTIETFHIEPEALLMIMKYCVNTKGENVGYPYIITVAKNWAYDGINTVAEVENRLISYQNISEDLKQVMKDIGTRKIPTIEEKELFLKWTEELGFELGSIRQAIKLNKKPTVKFSFVKLDEILMSYYEMKIFSIPEIEEYEKNKTLMFALAKKVAKELGLYYENYDKIVETYISKWVQMGFDESAVLKIASYCFSCSIRQFQGMDRVMQKFYKLGLLTVSSLQNYFAGILSQDEEIKEILSLCGAERQVNSFDRDFYRNWKENWKFPVEVIKEAASHAAGKAQPMKYINGVLANWNEQDVKTLEKAKEQGQFFVKEKSTEKPKARAYSKEQLDALFDSLEEIEV